MIQSWLKRSMMKFTVLLALGALPAAAPSKPKVVPEDISLAGQLLVASPEIGDARFDHRSDPCIDDGEKLFDTQRFRKIIAGATVFGDQRSWLPTCW